MNRAALLTVGIVTVASAANAQEPSGPSGRAVPGEPVEITVKGSKVPETFASTKGAAEIREKEIRASTPGSLADVLRGKAGTSVQQTTPGQGTIYVRGLAGRELVTTIDGVRVNTAIFRSPNNAVLSLIDPWSIFAVEVIRGPSSVLHGSDALGGVVAISTPLPPYSDEPVTIVRAIAAGTSNPLGSMSRVALRTQHETWAAHVGVSYSSFGDVVPGGGILSPDPSSYFGAERPKGGVYAPGSLVRAQLGTGFERLATDGVFRLMLSPRAEIVLRAQYAVRPDLVRYDEITPRFEPSGKPARVDSVLGPFSRTMTSAMLADRGGPWDTALLMLSWQRTSEGLRRWSWEEQCLDGCARLRLVPAARAIEERSRSDALSARGELRFLGDGKKRGAIFGVEAIHDTITSAAENVVVASGARSAADARYPSGARMMQGGIFAQLESVIFGKLRGHAGARGAFFALDVPARGGTDAIAKTTLDVALSAGLRFEPIAGLAWVANAGRGVRAPNVEDYAGSGTRAGGRFQVPNPDLRPEHVHSADTGIKVALGPFRAETFVFYTRFDDAIGVTSTTVDGKPRAPDGTRYVTSANVARIDFYGLESDLRFGDDKKQGVYARGLLVGHAESAAPGATASERVLTQPLGVIGAWLHPFSKLRLEAWVYARGPMRRVARVDDNRISPNGTDAFATVHARAAWQVNGDLTARLGVDNLFDARALEHGSGYYLPGLAVMAGLEARLAH